jgi:hypothetical protein
MARVLESAGKRADVDVSELIEGGVPLLGSAAPHDQSLLDS